MDNPLSTQASPIYRDDALTLESSPSQASLSADAFSSLARDTLAMNCTSTPALDACSAATSQKLPMVKTALKITAFFLLRCLASLIFISLFVPVALLELGTRLFTGNQRSLLTIALLPSTYHRQFHSLPILDELNQQLQGTCNRQDLPLSTP